MHDDSRKGFAGETDAVFLCFLRHRLRLLLLPLPHPWYDGENSSGETYVDSALSDNVQPQTQTAVLYFSVSITKLIIMSLCSLGIYDLFWAYQNWKLVKARATNEWDAQISPFWRAVFTFFYLYPLLKLIKQSMRENSVNGFLSPGWITFGFIALTICYGLPAPYWLIYFLSFIPLVVIQQRVNAINAACFPNAEISSRFSGWNKICIVLGGGALLLIIIGAFMD
jgi:hypothetical protein